MSSELLFTYDTAKLLSFLFIAIESKPASCKLVISACSNILSMSTADVLVASRSTFSLWSYFLSKQKTIFPKGFDLKKYLSETRNIHYV